MANLFDQYLLFRVRARRDPEAFARIYDRYVAAIFRFVVLKLPSREMAEDVTSEAFLRCWQFLQTGQEVANVRALLYRIARNLIVDTYRKSDHQPTAFSAVTMEGLSTSFLHEEGDISDQSKGRMVIEARADLSLILDRIARLKEDYRDVLTLRLIDGLSFTDIGTILEKTPGNVRVIYHRAIKALDQLDPAT
jgi:RNA polymerase sigma-70 factor (ECF subfamily)